MEKSSSFPSEKDPDSGSDVPENGNGKPIKTKNISILVLVVSLPILYASFLHIPPSTLFKDTTFWFLMSNTIIIFIVVDIGAVFAPSQDVREKKLYEDFVAYSSRPCSVHSMEDPPRTINKSLVVKEKLIDDSTSIIDENTTSSSTPEKTGARDASFEEAPSVKEVEKALVLVQNGTRNKKFSKARSLDPNVHHERSVVATDQKPLRRLKTQEKRGTRNKGESHDYEKLSDEELNRRVEEFIRRYYREMSLQLNNELAAQNFVSG